jgi:1,4-dihydroxy-2-naphthoate polyprenyltransferase
LESRGQRHPPQIDNRMGNGPPVPLVKKWIIAFRPWSLPASTMPVLFGTSLAVVVGGARLALGSFLLALAGMIILHSAANMLSDVFDFRRGLDREVTPVSGAIVRGWLTPRQVAAGSASLFMVGTVIGLILVLEAGRTLLLIGGLGLVIGVFYTGLKYHAFGDLAVFLDFGLLGSLGAWVVQTHRFSWIPVVWTIPMAMLVVAILHANNWRDSLSDRERRVTTVASILGDKGSFYYYGFLIFGSMLLIAAMIFIPRLAFPRVAAMPLTFLAVFLALPRALGLWGRARRRHAPHRPMDFVILDGATANYNLLFGLLCTSAAWLDLVFSKL